MANPTTNLSMTKPTVGGSTDTWGTTLNEEVVDVIDAVFAIGGTDVTMSDIKFNSVGLQETGAGTDTIKIQAPSAVTQYTLTMPGAVGASGQILRTSDASGTLAWVTDEEGDLKSVADATNGGMTVTNGTGPDVTLALNFNDLSAAVVDVAADSIGVLDATDSSTKKESIADLVSAMGGTGLTGASGQLGVDAAQTQITSLGTLTALQVDNININLNTISSTAGTDLNITPLTGQQIVLDGTIVIDAGVVTGATSITSTAFVGDVTGNADTATLATLASTVTVEATTNSTCSVALFESVSGSLAAKTDAGLTYNATSNVLAGTFNGALTGNVTGDVSGTAATVTGATQAAITTAANLVTVGALNSGSIASGFGTINNGSSSITGGAGSFTTLSGSTSLVLATGATVTGISNAALGTSATLLATQGAIKTYVDAAASQSLSDVLAVGNTTGSVDLIISAGQKIYTDTIAETTSAAGVTIDSVLLKDNVVTATTLAGTLSTATQNSVTTATGLVSVGALNAGSITSGFTSIDVGNGAITTTGTVSGTTLAGTLSTATQNSVTTATGLVSVGALGSGSISSGFGTINTGSSSITGGAGSFSSVVLATGATVTGIDNATLATGSAVLLATQGAIKTYVDSQVGASDTLAEVLANGNTTGAYDIEVSVGKKISTDTIGELSLNAGVTIDSVLVKDNTVTATTFTGALTGNASGTAATVTGATQAAITSAANLATVGTLGSGAISSGFGNIDVGSSNIDGGTITADTALVGTLSTAAQGNITSLGTIASLVATTADINGGTFDGIVGGTTPADGSFSTLSASSTSAFTGNVGIGASADAEALWVQQATSGNKLAMFRHTGDPTPNGVDIDFSAVALNNRTQFFLRGQDSGATKMNLWSDGGATFTGDVTMAQNGLLRLDGDDSGDTMIYSSSANVLTLRAGGVSTVNIGQTGVGIGAASGATQLYVYKAGDGQRPVKFETSNSGTALTFYNDTDGWALNCAGTMRFATGGTTVRMSISAAGTVDVVGTFTAGTKTFKIDHPLPDKADGYHLVHSSIEGPRADLIYRGTIDLVSGWVQVDLDSAAGMSEGTWDVLCRDPQVWVQNDSGWDAVRGSVEGNTLTIECAESDSDDTVSWMVVAERCDPHIMEAESTDEDGHIIVEPEKEQGE